MDSEPEESSSINDFTKDVEGKMEINGEVTTPQENGKHTVAVANDSSLQDEQVPCKSASREFCEFSEDPISVIKSTTTEKDQIGKTNELCITEEVDLTQSFHKEEFLDESKADANGEVKGASVLGKEGKPVIQRRMSLRPRAAPKKYLDADGSSDDDKDPLAPKDPLEIPLGKNSSTVLIRKSPISSTTLLKTPPKSPVKITKVTRPPPELIKAPILSKISISSATSVTMVPRSKENNSNNSGFVVVDTQSILKGKNAATVSSVPASVTVSAVPQIPKPVPKPAPSPVTSSANRKSTTSFSSNNSSSLPDPFESLGTFFLIFLYCKNLFYNNLIIYIFII